MIGTQAIRDLRLRGYCDEVDPLKVVESAEHVLNKCPLYQKHRIDCLLAFKHTSDSCHQDHENIIKQRTITSISQNFATKSSDTGRPPTIFLIATLTMIPDMYGADT